MATGANCICAAPGNRAACAPPTPSELAASTRPLPRTTVAMIAALLHALLCRHITTRGGQAALSAAMTRAFSARSLPRINWGSLGWSSLLSHTTPMCVEQHSCFQPAIRWVGKPARPRAGKTVPCLRPGHSRAAVSSRLTRNIDFPRLRGPRLDVVEPLSRRRCQRRCTGIRHAAQCADGLRSNQHLRFAYACRSRTNARANTISQDGVHNHRARL
jgi:hypothetical protein